MNVKKWQLGCLVAVIVAVIFLTAIGSLIYRMFTTGLPADLPDQFSFEVYEGGGMLNQSTTYELQDGQLIYTQQYGSSEIVVVANLTAAELEQIWQTLRTKRFDRIRDHDEGQVYDRGGTTMRLTFGKQSISVSDAGSSFVSGGGAGRFYAIEGQISALMAPYVQAQQRAITVRVSDELVSSIASIQLNDQILYSTSQYSTTAVLPIDAVALPGEYLLAVSTLVAPATMPTYQTLNLTITEPAVILISGTPTALTVSQTPLVTQPLE